MAFDSEFLRDTDKPALLAMDPPELLEKTRVIVAGLGYKVHVVRDHEEFNNRFGAVHYQLLILTDTFDSSAGPANPSLQRLQHVGVLWTRRNTPCFNSAAIYCRSAATGHHELSHFI